MGFMFEPFILKKTLSNVFHLLKKNGICKKKLKRKRLLPHAVPSLFLDKSVNDNCKDDVEEISDCLKSIEDLQSKFMASELRQDFLIYKEPSQPVLCFYYFTYNSCGAPKIIFSIKVVENLIFFVLSGDEMINVQKFSSVMKFSKSLVFFSDFINSVPTIVDATEFFKLINR